MRLLPRDEQFYQLFLNQIAVSVEASRVLLEGAERGNAQLATAAARINVLEQQGDEITHDIYVRLNQTFITPIDPEDIQSLSAHLDDILDGIEECAHRIVSYRVDSIPPTIIELCRIVHTAAKTLEQAFDALSKDKPLLAHCIEVNRLEEVADQIGRDAVSELFRTEKDCIRLIKLKEVYELLEQTVDFCEDVADALQNVVVKNA
jgi:predicted phosphate transport protein (TIGR00153 family)